MAWLYQDWGSLMTNSAPTVRRPWYQRLVAAVLLLFFIWHGFATIAWVSGDERLISIGPVKAYMNPSFRQAWSVFAPNPDDYNLKIQVRAELTNGSITPWYDLTDRDIADNIQGVPVLSRMYQSNFMLANHTLNDLNQVTPTERDILRASASTSTDAQLRARLVAAGANPNAGYVQRTLNENKSLTILASEVALARWGQKSESNIAKVQFRVLVVDVPQAPWTTSRPEPLFSPWEPGWRVPIWHPGMNETEIARRYGGDS